MFNPVGHNTCGLTLNKCFRICPFCMKSEFRTSVPGLAVSSASAVTVSGFHE